MSGVIVVRDDVVFQVIVFVPAPAPEPVAKAG